MNSPPTHLSRRGLGAIATAIVCLVGVGVFVLWSLHHPNPRVRAPLVLDRNSLLPHQYAGPCINCHRIKEGAPVVMNAGNMSQFRLSTVDRQLLLSGQRVEVPDLTQKLSIPAITRTDGLPHPYVGVCDNCHVTLDVHPSPAYMKEAMRRASQPLAGLNLPPGAAARAGSMPDIGRARYRRILGYIAVPLLLGTIVFIALRAFGRPSAEPDPKWLRIHAWFGAAFCVATLLHWYFSDRGNNFLHLALLGLGWLAGGGLWLRFRRGSVLMLNLQRIALVGLIALILVGHFFSDFD